MNGLDIAIIVLVGALVIVGFFVGVARVAAGLISLYISTILAAAFYDNLGKSIRGSVADISKPTADLIAFLILFLGLGVILFLVTWQGFRSVNTYRSQLAILDNIGGAALAITLGVLAIALTLSVAVIILGVLNQSSTAGGMENLGGFGDQVRDSSLVPIFLKLQPAITLAFQPWFPNGLPPILEPPPTV